jgi:hypothetical protein
MIVGMSEEVNLRLLRLDFSASMVGTFTQAVLILMSELADYRGSRDQLRAGFPCMSEHRNAGLECKKGAGGYP